MEKKHTRNFSLDVHPYMANIQKPKLEMTNPEPPAAENSLDTVYIEGTHSVVHASSALTGNPTFTNSSLVLG